MERAGSGGCDEICLDNRQGKHFVLESLEHFIHILILNKTATFPKKRYPHHSLPHISNVLIQLTTTSHDPKAHAPIAVAGAVVKPGSASSSGDSSRLAIANGNSGGSNNSGGVVAGVLVTSAVISADNNNDNNNDNSNNDSNSDPLDMMMTIEEPREVEIDAQGNEGWGVLASTSWLNLNTATSSSASSSSSVAMDIQEPNIATITAAVTTNAMDSTNTSTAMVVVDDTLTPIPASSSSSSSASASGSATSSQPPLPESTLTTTTSPTPAVPLLVPGRIIHLYRSNGRYHAAEISSDHPTLQVIKSDYIMY